METLESKFLESPRAKISMRDKIIDGALAGTFVLSLAYLGFNPPKYSPIEKHGSISQTHNLRDELPLYCYAGMVGSIVAMGCRMIGSLD